ncbi:MAG: ATP-binding cassette domain-containing protein [Phycisphaerae bacterium]|jgi:putative ABC transport system ATP-binding protein|nr:ATP-binding cassette domain-containing protein [Phycisphaerae bacterium]
MKQPPAIKIDNLTVRLDGKDVLDRLSLQIETGEKVIFTGPSGCGKTTLFRAILGFIEPDEGDIFIEGTQLTPESVWTVRTKLAYVAQEPDMGTGNVREILEQPMTYRANIGQRKNLSRVPELFDHFSLPRELLNKDMGSLSGGEKQRVALIAAILLDRKIYLLDEPTSALDQAARQTVLEYFQTRNDLTVLCISHATERIDPNQRIIELCSSSKGVDR